MNGQLAQGQAGTGEQTAGDLADLPAGAEVGGRFRIRREIGRGGMGIVYEAMQIALDREVALKTLHPELLRDPLALERFQREARAAAAIEHNGIVRVFDLATVDGVAFIVMERLRGEDLRSRIKRAGALGWQAAVKVGRELADAIAAAHARGILHRDLSPANVFLSRDGADRESVKVLDFGVARLLSAAGLRSQPTLGTLMYMAPERVAGADAADPRSDVYAIGAVLYEAIAGVPPFSVCEYPELALKIALQEPLPLRSRAPECPDAVTAVVQRAMHRDPAQRFQSACELCAALEAIAPEPRQSVAPAVLQTAPTAPPLRERGSRKRWMRPALAIGACAFAALIVFLQANVRSRTLELESRAARPAPPAVGPPAAVPVPEEAPVVLGAQTVDHEQPATHEPAKLAPSPVKFVSHPAGARVTVADVGACRTPCVLSLPPRAGIVVRAQDGTRRAWQRLPYPLPAQVELSLKPGQTSIAVQPSREALPPLMPRR